MLYSDNKVIGMHTHSGGGGICFNREVKSVMFGMIQMLLARNEGV